VKPGSGTAAQEVVSSDFLAPNAWAQTAILNVARTGKFSSDRTILEYAHEIWGVSSIVG
jgi:starch phosphorylase